MVIKNLKPPLWLFVLESLYRNRITLISDKFTDNTSIVFIHKDLHSNGLNISYVHLLRIIKLLVSNNFATKKKVNRESIIVLTEKGNVFVKGINKIELYNLLNSKK